MKHKNTFSLESVSFKNLLLFSFPIFLSLFFNGLYSTIDLWMVSRFALSEDVSAVSIGGNFITIIVSLFSGLSIGCSVELATKLAENDNKNVGYLAGTSIRLFALLGLIFAFFIFLFAPFFTSLMHTPEESVSRTILYLRVSAIGCIPLSLFVLISAIFKALGNSKIPFAFVAISSIFNIILNYIFVKYFHIGTLGVAVATLSSQTLSVVLSLFYIHKKHFPFRFGKREFEAHKGYTKHLLKVGLPIAAEEIFTEGSFIVILSFANTFGLSSSAGIGIAGKIVSFLMFIPLTFMQTVSVFSATSLGHLNIKEARKSLRLSLYIASIIGIIVFLVLEFLPQALLSLFTSDESVILNGVEFLKTISLECLLLSFTYCFLGFFEGSEKTLFVMFQGVAATLLIKIPYAYYASFISTNSSISALALSLEIASIVELFGCIVYYLVLLKKRKKDKPISVF